MRTLMYQEDEQGYSFRMIIFMTDCKASVNIMKDISYKPASAGRFSTKFPEFKKLMEKHGFIVKKIKTLKENVIPENNTLEIVEGATGSY